MSNAGAEADHGSVCNGDAAIKSGASLNGNKVSNLGRTFFVGKHSGIVLNVAALPDGDGAHVA